MSRAVLHNCLRRNLLTRGLRAPLLAGPRDRKHRMHKVTNWDRKVQVGMTNRPMAVSHHLKIVRHVTAGTPDDQSNRKGEVRPVAAVATVVEAAPAPAPVRAHPIQMRMRTRSNNSPALSGVAGETQKPGGIKRRSSNVLHCLSQADTEPGRMRFSKIPPQPQGGRTIRQSFGFSRHSTKRFLSST